MEIKSYLNKQKKIIEKALLKYIPESVTPFEYHIEAMRYSLFAGGKRVRPILCLAAAQAITPDLEITDNILPIACALECIHTYSLIHDDLPAMDNDNLRRGKPTNHILYGEANAILAGDSLLTFAFDLITDQSNSSLTAEQRITIGNIISKASGPFGMVGGQSLDIAYENQDFPFETLKTIHRSKTGALITASVHTGAIGAGADAEEIKALQSYGNQIGLAFQIVDDLLNVTGTTEQLGKSAGTDEVNGKATYPAYFGTEDTRKKARQATNDAKDALVPFGTRAEPLRALADYINLRSH